MKLFLSALAVLGGWVMYNMQPPYADQAVISHAQPALSEKATTYKMDTALSTLNWTGTKPSGKHTGSIKITEGSLEVKKEKILSGNFSIDMNTISNLDENGKSSAGLVKHLKNADFFDVPNFPTATFTLTGIEKIDPNEKVILEGATNTISGNLMMRGVTQNISFPAIVAFSDGVLKAKADFNIDRTRWGVNYGTVGGKVANDINLKIDITANK